MHTLTCNDSYNTNKNLAIYYFFNLKSRLTIVHLIKLELP